MEKDIGKIPKNETTEILVRIDDFGGKRGVTIREFVTSDRYTGFTKAGTRIAADKFLAFRDMINSIDLSELTGTSAEAKEEPKQESVESAPEEKEEVVDY